MMDPKIIRTRDRDGRAVVRVEMANCRGVFATLDADDFDNWIAVGLPTRFLLNRNGPGTHRVIFYDSQFAGGNVGLAREIMKPGRGRKVRYLDGDRLNLRRTNLAVEAGYARGQSHSDRALDSIGMNREILAAA